MARSIKKGPFIDAHLLKRVDVGRASNDKKSDQDLVAPFDDPAGLRRSDHCRA
jgi:hypothetical protein